MFMSFKNRNVHKYFVTVSACALMASLGLAQAQVAPADETTEQTAERLAREQGFIRPNPTPEEAGEAPKSESNSQAAESELWSAADTRAVVERARELCRGGLDLSYKADDLLSLYDSVKDKQGDAKLSEQDREFFERCWRLRDTQRDQMTTSDTLEDALTRRAMRNAADALVGEIEGDDALRRDKLFRDRSFESNEELLESNIQKWQFDKYRFEGEDAEYSSATLRNFGDDTKYLTDLMIYQGWMEEGDDLEEAIARRAQTVAKPKGGVVQEGYLFPVDDKDDGIEEDTEDDYFRDVYVRGSITIGEGEITDRGEITAGTEISAEDEAAIIKALVDEVSVVSANIEIAVPDFTPVSLEDVRIIGIVRIMEGDENGARDIDSGGTTDIGLVYADIFDTSSSSTSTGVFFGNSFDIDTRAEADLERLDLALGVFGKLGSTLNIDGDASAGLKLNYSKDEVKSSSFAEVDVAALFGAGTTNSVQTNDLETDRESYGIGINASYEYSFGEFSIGGLNGSTGLTIGANGGLEYYDSQGTFSQLTTSDAGVVGSGEASVAFDDSFDDSGFGVHGGVFAEIGLQLSPEDANLDIDFSFGASLEDLGGGYPVYDQAFSPLGQPSGWDTERVDVTTTYVRIGLEF